LGVNISQPVFNKVGTSRNWGNEINDVKFKLKVKAYAIQSENVTAPMILSMRNFFGSQFSGLAWLK
jgi:hypothetical protein